jgi:hypothetical protein
MDKILYAASYYIVALRYRNIVSYILVLRYTIDDTGAKYNGYMLFSIELCTQRYDIQLQAS